MIKLNGEEKYTEDELKRAGIRYVFEHDSGSVRIDVLAMNEDEAREVIFKTLKRSENYYIVMVDVNGMADLK